MSHMKLSDWLEEHDLTAVGPILNGQGIDRLEDLWSLEGDDLEALGIPSGYVNKILSAMGRKVTGSIDTTDEELPLPTPDGFGDLMGRPDSEKKKKGDGEIEFMTLDRAGAAPGRAARKPATRGGRGRGRGRGGARGAGGSSVSDGGGGAASSGIELGAVAEPNFFSQAAESSGGRTVSIDDGAQRIKTGSKMTAFLEFCGLEECAAELTENGIDLYDDLASLCLEDFESLGISHAAELSESLASKGKIGKDTDGFWIVSGFKVHNFNPEAEPEPEPIAPLTSALSMGVERVVSVARRHAPCHLPPLRPPSFALAKSRDCLNRARIQRTHARIHARTPFPITPVHPSCATRGKRASRSTPPAWQKRPRCPPHLPDDGPLSSPIARRSPLLSLPLPPISSLDRAPACRSQGSQERPHKGGR